MATPESAVTPESATEVATRSPIDHHECALTLLERNKHNQRTRLFGSTVSLVLLSLVAAIVTQRPEVLALGAPFLLALAAAVALYEERDVDVALWLSAGRVVEGESLGAIVELTARNGVPRAEVELVVSVGLVPISPLRVVDVVPRNTSKHLAFELEAIEWGIGKIESVRVRAVGRLGLFSRWLEYSAGAQVHVAMPDERVQAPMQAERFRRIVGSHLSPDRGQGVEIADIRPWQPGDTHKDINWRITNRRGEPWITLRHPDRSTNLVVVVDAHEGDDTIQRSTQRKSVSAALAIARAHLSRHDRVGLLIVGHTVQWLPPQLGRNHLYAMADALVTVGNAPDASLRLYRPVAVNTIASDTIVVAISPLFDPRMANLLAELRSRGNPVSVLVPAADRGTKALVGRRIDDEARRLAAIEYRGMRGLLTDRGVAMMDWPDDVPVAAIVASLQRLRRSMQRSRSAGPGT